MVAIRIWIMNLFKQGEQMQNDIHNLKWTSDARAVYFQIKILKQRRQRFHRFGSYSQTRF